MKKLVLREVGKQAQRPRAPEAGEVVILGVDLSRSKWVYACRWGGQEQRRFGSAGELKHLQAVVREYQQRGCEVHVVYEACGFGYQIAWWLEAHNAPVIVVAPSCVEKAPGAPVKTDGLDAGSLALKSERGMLKGIYIPTREQHEYRQLSRTYGQALKDRRRQQVRLRMLLQEHGYTPPAAGSGWGRLERWLSAQPWPPPVGSCVAELRELRASASRSARRLANELRAVGRLPQYVGGTTALAAQSGVGRFTAIRFLLEGGDIHRFATADALPNYLGLAPREYSSGDLVHRGRIRKCGPGSLRAWLVCSAPGRRYVPARTRRWWSVSRAWSRGSGASAPLSPWHASWPCGCGPGGWRSKRRGSKPPECTASIAQSPTHPLSSSSACVMARGCASTGQRRGSFAALDFHTDNER